MTARTQEARTLPPTWRWRALLVLGLLVGLLGMHGLGPGGAGVMAAHHTAHPSSHEQGMSDSHGRGVSDSHGRGVSAVAPPDESVCHPSDDGHGGGHGTQHADSTCTSGAVAAGYVPPAPVADPVGVTRTDETVDRSAVASPHGGRAPPSLAELQLLRI
ncbi:DUF6153 family protein [Streptomyces sp. 2A115]|uniref:DUF6153 family protein n=1 Tax=Streptomyces sp. 2A115 TaxID=3457439 RepID=UPI003FD1CC1C